jgi:signal transduction histidine kinase
VGRRWALYAAIASTGVAVVTLLLASARVDDDEVRWLIVLASAAFLADFVLVYVWAAGSDTATKDAMVERADTASKLSHELKNPLMSIKGLSSTAVSLYDRMEDEERREFFQLIDEESGRLKRIVEQAATALKVDAEQLTYDLQSHDLGAMVQEVAWAVPHADHPMTVEAEPDLQASVDRRHFGEAIEILIDNAVKFSPPDAPIEVTVRRLDGRAVIDVADRGPGIPAERLGRVFERFGRWRPAGYEETPGAGLGLFIARAHVLAHDGRIEIVEREDGGTIVRVTLPEE